MKIKLKDVLARLEKAKRDSKPTKTPQARAKAIAKVADLFELAERMQEAGVTEVERVSIRGGREPGFSLAYFIPGDHRVVHISHSSIHTIGLSPARLHTLAREIQRRVAARNPQPKGKRKEATRGKRA